MIDYTKEELLYLEKIISSLYLPEKLIKLKALAPSDSNHYDFLYQVAHYFEPSPMVEIGTHKGVSAWALGSGNPDGKVFTVDINPTSGEYISKNAECFIGDSVELSTQMPDKIELLFIDGGHTYEQVTADYETYQSKMRGGGLVLIDDIFSPTAGVMKFWKQLKHKNKIEFMNIHKNYGFGGIICE